MDKTEPRPDGPDGELERQVLWQIQHLGLEYVGYKVEEPFVAYGAPRVDEAGRAAYLAEPERRVLAAAAKPVDRSMKTADPLAVVPGNAWAGAR